MATATVLAGSLATGAPTAAYASGCGWTEISPPSLPTQTSENFLVGVAVTSRRNAWAVDNMEGDGKVAILRWNGAAWSVQARHPGRSDSLFGMAASSTSNAWAVGGLIVHWNGRRWSRQAMPKPGASRELYGVAATSKRNAWAVGMYGNTHSSNPYILRWNGRRWRRQAIPGIGTYDSLSAVAAISASNAWAVGAYFDGAQDQPLILHWNGHSWSLSTAAISGSGGIKSVAAISGSDVWAVGTYHPDPANPVDTTLALHWDGTS